MVRFSEAWATFWCKNFSCGPISESVGPKYVHFPSNSRCPMRGQQLSLAKGQLIPRIFAPVPQQQLLWPDKFPSCDWFWKFLFRIVIFNNFRSHCYVEPSCFALLKDLSGRMFFLTTGLIFTGEIFEGRRILSALEDWSLSWVGSTWGLPVHKERLKVMKVASAWMFMSGCRLKGFWGQCGREWLAQEIERGGLAVHIAR